MTKQRSLGSGWIAAYIATFVSCFGSSALSQGGPPAVSASVVANPTPIPLGTSTQFTTTTNGDFPVTGGYAWKFWCTSGSCAGGTDDTEIDGMRSPLVDGTVVGTMKYNLTVTWQAMQTSGGGYTPPPTTCSTSFTVLPPDNDTPSAFSFGINDPPTQTTASTCQVVFGLSAGGWWCGSLFLGTARELIERPQIGYKAWGSQVLGKFWLSAPNIVDNKQVGYSWPNTMGNWPPTVSWPALAVGDVFDDFFQTNEVTVYDCCGNQVVITMPRRHFQKQRVTGGWKLIEL